MSTVPNEPLSTRAAAKALEADLLAAGFRAGPPPYCKTRVLATDRLACRKMICGNCRHRGLDHRPFHRSLIYRALAVCRRCGAAEEV
ncbi:MAG: hypothetical protein K2R98_16825 [Gemmataceae bacterium]|nr:hypothetical protein [Gemmataceae bacterium]